MENPLSPLKIVLLILLSSIVGVGIAAYTKADSFAIKRSIVIKASQESIFPKLNDFRNWVYWSPHEQLDPGMNRVFDGSLGGVGARYSWRSFRAGSGRMEIVEETFPSAINIQLHMRLPFRVHNQFEFTLERSEGATTVTWLIHGKTPFISKVVSILASTDAIIGNQMSKALVNLKAVVER